MADISVVDNNIIVSLIYRINRRINIITSHKVVLIVY